MIKRIITLKALCPDSGYGVFFTIRIIVLVITFCLKSDIMFI